MPVVAVNRVGLAAGAAEATEGAECGVSSVGCGAQGELLARAGHEREVLIRTIDRDRTDKVRRIWPYLRDRRIDAYADLSLRYRDKR